MIQKMKKKNQKKKKKKKWNKKRPKYKGEDSEEEVEYNSNDEDGPDWRDPNWKNHILKFKPEKKVKDPSRLVESERYTTFDPLLLSKVKPISQHKRRLAGDKKLDW